MAILRKATDDAPHRQVQNGPWGGYLWMRGRCPMTTDQIHKCTCRYGRSSMTKALIDKWRRAVLVDMDDRQRRRPSSTSRAHLSIRAIVKGEGPDRQVETGCTCRYGRSSTTKALIDKWRRAVLVDMDHRQRRRPSSTSRAHLSIRAIVKGEGPHRQVETGCTCRYGRSSTTKALANNLMIWAVVYADPPMTCR